MYFIFIDTVKVEINIKFTRIDIKLVEIDIKLHRVHHPSYSTKVDIRNSLAAPR